MTTFQAGDLVAILTINGGRAVYRERQRVEEAWAGRIVGPSPIGEGWWLVRRIDPASGKIARGRSRVVTVPESEMSKP